MFVTQRWTERDTREREKVIEEKEWCRRESELDYIKLGFPFLPHEFFFNLSLKSSTLYLTFNRSRVQYTQLPGGFFHYFNSCQS